MKKLETKMVEVDKDELHCPHCSAFINIYDAHPGLYRCGECDDVILFEQHLIDQANNYREEETSIEDLEKRVKRLEKELGIK